MSVHEAGIFSWLKQHAPTRDQSAAALAEVQAIRAELHAQTALLARIAAAVDPEGRHAAPPAPPAHVMPAAPQHEDTGRRRWRG